MVDKVYLERFAYTPEGVFGRLVIPEFICYTVERPWLDNKPQVSCIPEGIYSLKLSRYERGGYPAYEVTNVPNRTMIKIHIGNTMDDVIGCIALGKTLGFTQRKWAVLNSGKAFQEFMAAMAETPESVLEIGHYRPGSMGIAND